MKSKLISVKVEARVEVDGNTFVGEVQMSNHDDLLLRPTRYWAELAQKQAEKEVRRAS